MTDWVISLLISSTPEVEKPPLSAEDVHAVSALSEKMCLLSTRLPDADNQEDVKLLGLCKVFVTCSILVFEAMMSLYYLVYSNKRE